MNDDSVLLRRYTEEGSETAFAELVRRYVDLVYGAALRRTVGNAPLAADVSQHVFTALAGQARRLAPDTVLGAWLHTATRNAALKLMISEQRRRVRETQAMALGTVGGSGNEAATNWEELRPLLDAAVDELPEADRTSLVLRFFERRPFAEIGAALRLSEDAARMRTERALDKLRAALNRRGIRSTAAALAAVVSSQPLISAPAGLAATIAAQAFAAGASVGILGATISFMSAKIITTATVSAIVAFLIGGYVGLHRNAATGSEPIVDISRLEKTVQSLRGDNRRLEDEAAALHVDAATVRADLAAAKETNASLSAKQVAAQPMAKGKSPNIGMVRHELQQAVLNNLRQIAAARDQYHLKNGRPATTVHDLVGRGSYIKTVRTVGGEDYSELSMLPGAVLTTTTPDGISVTYDPAGVLTTKPDIPPEVVRAQELAQRTKPAIDKALAAFRAANNGTNPANEQALLPYFATPQEGADFVELVEAQKAGRL